MPVEGPDGEGLRPRLGRRAASRQLLAVWMATPLVALTALWATATVGQQSGALPDGALRFDPWAATQEPPASHTVDWLLTHGVAATQQSCGSCHAESDCVECHAGAAAPIVVHPPGWLLAHGPTVHVASGSCSNCHTAERFCVGCHAQARFTSTPGYDPAAGERAHPAGWGGPGGHGEAAQADLTQCASCHTEDECVACHATVNPHGDGFGRDCRRLLDLGAPTCATCHADGSTLPLDAVRARCAP